MRYLALLLVLLAPAALGNVPCYGGTVVYAPTVEDCPKRISDVSITPTVGGFNLGYTSEGGVTLEIAVEAGHDQRCPGCPYATGTSDQLERRVNYARLDWKGIRDATGMSLNSQQDASTAGDYSISITGLANAAEYSIHLLPIEADDSYGQAWQRNVTTLDSAESDDQPEWFAGVGGNDLADCLTRATRCATPAPILAAMDVSDDVALEPASVFASQFAATVNGTAANMSIWGTNYESGGVNYWWWEGPTPKTVTRAKFLGTMGDCVEQSPITCVFDSASARPSSIYSGLAELGSHRYIVFGGVAVYDSAGRGIHARDGSHIVLRDNDVNRIGFGGIHTEHGSTHNVVIGNVVHRATSCERAQDEGRLPPGFSVGNCEAGTSAQSSCVKIGTVTENSFSLIAGNIVTDCAGEAFGTASGSRAWFEQNIMHTSGLSGYLDHFKYGYYVRNLAVGLGVGGFENQSGFTSGAESSAVDRGEGTGANHQIWAFNISVGNHLALGMRNVGNANIAAGHQTWSEWYYNTAILPTSYGLSLTGTGISTVTSDLKIQGNAVWVDHSEVCNRDTNNGTFSHNAWSASPPANCSGAGDVVGALTWPRLASEYQGLTVADATTWTLADYKPVGANENVGPVVATPGWAISDLANPEWDFARQWDGEGYYMWGAAGCVVTVEAASLLTGANCQGLDGTPDMGAVQ